MIRNTGIIELFLRKVELRNEKNGVRFYIDEKKYFFFFKRALDIAGSLFFIVVVMSWLTPIVALLIKCSSRGPVFFLQKRIGRGCKKFTCFKFRTMVVNSEADFKQATENDSRITRIGKFLRKTNIDEFPQFMNVLIGDMSIVGPRPHMLAECSRFSTIVPGYKFRCMVKPGITGLAQVKGFHGPTLNFENIFRRYQWDTFYVRNADVWLDFRIMYRTAAQRISFLLMYF